MICDLQPVGKRLVRGPKDVPKKWFTFCPRRRFPKDRILISICDKCQHFHGFRSSFSEEVTQSINENRILIKKNKFNISDPSRSYIKFISEEALRLAVKMKEDEDKHWEKEEEKIHQNLIKLHS